MHQPISFGALKTRLPAGLTANPAERRSPPHAFSSPVSTNVDLKGNFLVNCIINGPHTAVALLPCFSKIHFRTNSCLRDRLADVFPVGVPVTQCFLTLCLTSVESIWVCALGKREQPWIRNSWNIRTCHLLALNGAWIALASSLSGVLALSHCLPLLIKREEVFCSGSKIMSCVARVSALPQPSEHLLCHSACSGSKWDCDKRISKLSTALGMWAPKEICMHLLKKGFLTLHRGASEMAFGKAEF